MSLKKWIVAGIATIFCLILLIGCAIVAPTQTPPLEPSSQTPSSAPSTDTSSTNVISDERIGVVAGVERTEIYPEELKQPAVSGRSQNVYPPPDEGQIYFIVRLFMKDIYSGYIPADLKGTKDRSSLIDSAGKEYKIGPCTVKGVRFSDPNSLASNAFAVQDSTWIFLSEISTDAKPVKFIFFYPFQESKDQTSSEWYSIEIDLKN